MSEKRDKPGLELLIRKRSPDGAEGGQFELKRLQADRVFLRLRPRRSTRNHVEETALDEAGGEAYMLRNVDRDRYLRLNAREYYIWQRIDGANTIQDLAVAYFQAFGSLELDEIRSFLNKARRLGAIQVRPTTLFRAREAARQPGLVGALGRLATFDRRWEDVDGHFTRLRRSVGLLFTRWLLPLHGALIALGVWVYATGRAGGFGAAGVHWLAHAALVALALPALIALHELAHGLATKASGRRVKAVGITLLDYVLPSVYVDVTDMFMASRWQRIGVSLAGPMINLVTGAVFAGAAALSADPWLSRVAVGLADASYLLAAITLWPFHGLKEDGYHAFTDLVRVTALREHTAQLIAWALPGVDEPEPARPWWPLVLYGLAVAGTWLAALALLVA